MDTDESGSFWSQFVLLVNVMRELGVLSFFLEHSVETVVSEEVRESFLSSKTIILF